MIKLNKDERNVLYTILAIEIEESLETRTIFGYEFIRYGFCKLFTKITLEDNDNNKYFYIDDNFETDFPELYAKKPANASLTHWFPTDRNGWKERLKLLKQCIKETL